LHLPVFRISEFRSEITVRNGIPAELTEFRKNSVFPVFLFSKDNSGPEFRLSEFRTGIPLYNSGIPEFRYYYRSAGTGTVLALVLVLYHGNSTVVVFFRGPIVDLVATKNVRNGPFNEEVDFFDFLAKIGHRTVRAYDTRYQVPGTSQKMKKENRH